MSEARDWRPVRAAFCEAFGALLGIGRNQLSLPDRLGMTLLEPKDGWRIIVTEPLTQFVRELPFERLLVGISAKLARDEDIDRGFHAVGSQAINRLGTGRIDLCLAPEFHQDGYPWWSFFDRPWLWNAVERFTWAAQSTFESRRLLSLELGACEVVLALRVSRDAHGRWPERLDDLVPGILPGVPRDPFDGAPFRYRLTTNGWVLCCAALGAEFTPERIDSAVSKSESGVNRPRLDGSALHGRPWSRNCNARHGHNAKRRRTPAPAVALPWIRRWREDTG